MLLVALVCLGLVVYAVFDCLQTPVANLSVAGRRRWVAAIVLIPLLGAVAWILLRHVWHPRVSRRPRRERPPRQQEFPGPARRHERVRFGPTRADGYGWTAEGAAGHPIGPDDDPEFLAGLARAQRERNHRARNDPGDPDGPDTD